MQIIKTNKLTMAKARSLTKIRQNLQGMTVRELIARHEHLCGAKALQLYLGKPLDIVLTVELRLLVDELTSRSARQIIL